jgi:hypothetical protein
MKDCWLFVFATAPDYPVVIMAVFPPEMLEEAIEYRDKASGYRTLRKAPWRLGPLPSYSETLEV